MTTNNKVSTATIIRTVCLAIALANQILSATGHSVIPIDNDTVQQLISAGATVVTAIIGWWYNNSFTSEAIAADDFLCKMQKK